MAAAAGIPHDIVIFTDGGSRGNPGDGGWGFIMVDPLSGDCLQRCGGERGVTNNRMEYTAALRALEAVAREGRRVAIVTDSRLLVDTMTSWVAGWKRRGWRTAGGEPVKNRDLVEQLDRLSSRQRVAWRWIKGHAGHEGNEWADALTNQAMDDLRRGRDPAWEDRSVLGEARVSGLLALVART